MRVNGWIWGAGCGRKEVWLWELHLAPPILPTSVPLTLALSHEGRGDCWWSRGCFSRERVRSRLTARCDHKGVAPTECGFGVVWSVE